MSERTVPAHTVLTCDVCEREGTMLPATGAFAHGGLVARISDWCPEAGHDYRLDLCDECRRDFDAWRRNSRLAATGRRLIERCAKPAHPTPEAGGAE